MIINDIEGSDPSKDTNLLKRMGEVGDALHKTDKGIDAVQEFVAESGPWFADIGKFLSGG